MLSFTSSLSPDCEAFAIFVTEKYDYKNKKNILSNNEVKKINSFLDVLKVKKKDEELSSFDVSNQQKCFIIKVKNKYENYYAQEIGGALFSYIKKFKDIKKVEFYVDSLDFDKEKTAKFFSEFIFGFSLTSYTFNKYKTLDKDKINKKIDFKIITSHKQKMEAYYKYCDAIKEGVFLTRDLVSEPPNVLSPKAYVSRIKKLSKLGLKIKAYGETLSIAFAGKNQHQDTGAKMIHLAPDTTSKITSKSVSRANGRSTYRGLLRVRKGATNVKATVRCDALLLDDTSKTDTYPYMEINQEDATVTHEATVGKIGDEQIFYLMSRGFTEEEALSLIVNGFMEPFTKELPMEYAVELNRLIRLEMDNSVG